MSSRYFSNALIALLGGFVVVVSQALTASVVGWIAFAIGIAVVVISAVAQLDRGRGFSQRLLDLPMVALGGLAMAFGVGATGAVQTWTSFAFALGWVGLSFVGLTLHEIASWRIRHGLSALRWSTMEEPVPLAPTMARPHDRVA